MSKTKGRSVPLSTAAAKKSAARKAKEDRRTNIINLIMVLAFVLAVAVGFVCIRGLYLPFVEVLTVDGYDMDAVMFNYFYRDTYDSFQSAYGEMLDAYGTIDPDKPLNEQTYSNGYTWADFFYDTALQNTQRSVIIYQTALAAGYELSESGAAAVAEELESVKSGAKRNGFVTPGAFVRAHYGRGAGMESYEEYLLLKELADEYSAASYADAEYTDSELEAWYSENYPDAGSEHDYNTVNFRLIYLPYSGYAYDEELGYYGYSAETMEYTMAQLESVTADYMELPAEERTEAAFAELAAEYSSYLSDDGGLYKNAYKGDSGIETQVQNWIFGKRTAGDADYVSADSGAYLLYWVGEDMPVWEYLALQGLRNDNWNEWYLRLAENVETEASPKILTYLNLDP